MSYGEFVHCLPFVQFRKGGLFEFGLEEKLLASFLNDEKIVLKNISEGQEIERALIEELFAPRACKAEILKDLLNKLEVKSHHYINGKFQH